MAKQTLILTRLKWNPILPSFSNNKPSKRHKKKPQLLSLHHNPLVYMPILPFENWRDRCLWDDQEVKTENHKKVAEDLYLDAKQWFTERCNGKQINVFGENALSLSTNSTYSHALANLLHVLGPCFVSSSTVSSSPPIQSQQQITRQRPMLQCRYLAIRCITGAIEGCTELSLEFHRILSKFLLAYCAPFSESDDEDIDENHDNEFDEHVRDAAITAITSFIKINIVFPQEENDNNNQQHFVYLKLELAKSGVQHRCDTNAVDDMDNYGMIEDTSQDIRDGLSLLPRSRRALCFDLLRAAVEAMTTVPQISLSNTKEASSSVTTTPTTISPSQISSSLSPSICSIQSSMSKFAIFVAKCLQGESDPRCLMQMLGLLNHLQHTFLPHYRDAEHSNELFPTGSIFDAVAPYYPIQFHPPPNDPHGITQSGLQNALMSILVFHDYDMLGEDSQSSMLHLATSLVVERLMDGATSTTSSTSSLQDKLEALHDLKILLKASPQNLTPEHIRELSHTLWATHNDCVEGVTLGKPGPYKALADKCRSFVTKLALQLEVSNADLWHVFVMETLEAESPILASSPQSLKGRTTIAYLACLTASGGPQTITMALHYCLPKLQMVLMNSEDPEQISAACYGLSAFFSSLDVAFSGNLDNDDTEGNHRLDSDTSNPLKPYSSPLLQRLKYHLSKDRDDDGVQLAVFHAITSLLHVTPPNILTDADIELIREFLQEVSNLLECDSEHSKSKNLKDDMAKFLGQKMALSIEKSDGGLSSVFNRDTSISVFLSKTLLPHFLSLCLQPKPTLETRFDVLTIAHAASKSPTIASKIFQDLFDSLILYLKQNEKEAALSISNIIGKVLKVGGKLSKEAFHATNSDPIQVIPIIGHDSSPHYIWSPLTNMLNLPNFQSSDMLCEADQNSALEFGYKVLSPFLPAFESDVPKERLKSLVKFMDQILPPVSEWQIVQLSLSLALVAVAVKQHRLPFSIDDSVITDASRQQQQQARMTSLLDVCLSSKYPSRARSDAATSLYWMLRNYDCPISMSSHDETSQMECFATSLIETSLYTEIHRRLEVAFDSREQKSIDLELFLDDVKDSLQLAAMVGSAAAYLGVETAPSSSTTAPIKVVDFAQFLISACLYGTMKNPSDSSPIQFTRSLPHSSLVLLHMAFANAFGSLLMSTLKCLPGSASWTYQRLLNFALQGIETLTHEQKLDRDVMMPSFWGKLALTAQVMACTRWSVIVEPRHQALLVDSLMFDLLLLYPRQENEELNSILVLPDVVELIELILAGILKAWTTNSHKERDIHLYCSNIIVAMIRILSQKKDHRLGHGVMALALQILCTVISTSDGIDKTLTSKFQPAVIGLLKAMLDHPSSTCRQMIVETINIWSVLD